MSKTGQVSTLGVLPQAQANINTFTSALILESAVLLRSEDYKTNQQIAYTKTTPRQARNNHVAQINSKLLKLNPQATTIGRPTEKIRI